MTEIDPRTDRPVGWYLTPDGLPPLMPTEEQRAAAKAARNTPTERIIRHARLRLFRAVDPFSTEKDPHRARMTDDQRTDARDLLWTAREALRLAVAERDLAEIGK